MIAAQIARQFAVEGRLVSVKPTGSGNINDTYTAIFRTTFDQHRFILQRINGRVFADPELIMQNMRRITDHVHPKLENDAEDADRIWQLPKVIRTTDDRDMVIDEQGNMWRAISLIASASAFDRVQSLEHAREVGIVLGHFQRQVSDLDPDSLAITLPGFHNAPGYLRKLHAALETKTGQARLTSSVDAEHCLRFVRKRETFVSILEDARSSGELLARPIHGDPKINNIMIDDDTGQGTCIIDLDTVMPGLVHYDFGDCLRSCCNPAGEETLNLSEVVFDSDLCEAIVGGYLREAGAFLTEADRHYLYDAIRLLTLELGIRFFADYLAGDPYFKTTYDGQNLNRARIQFRLVECIETRERQIRRILDEAAP